MTREGYTESELTAANRLAWLLSGMKADHLNDDQIERFGKTPDACLSELIVESRLLPHQGVKEINVLPSGKVWYKTLLGNKESYVVGEKIYPYHAVTANPHDHVPEHVGFVNDVPLVVSPLPFEGPKGFGRGRISEEWLHRKADLLLLAEGTLQGTEERVLFSGEGLWNATPVSENRILFSMLNKDNKTWSACSWDRRKGVVPLGKSEPRISRFLEFSQGEIMYIPETRSPTHSFSRLRKGKFETVAVDSHEFREAVDFLEANGCVYQICPPNSSGNILVVTHMSSKIFPGGREYLRSGKLLAGKFFAFIGRGHHQTERWVFNLDPSGIWPGPAFQSVTDLFTEGDRRYYYGLSGRHLHKVAAPHF